MGPQNSEIFPQKKYYEIFLNKVKTEDNFPRLRMGNDGIVKIILLLAPSGALVVIMG